MAGMSLTCKYQVRAVPCGTEFDGVTVKRRLYLALHSGTGHFTGGQVDLIRQSLTTAQMDFKYLPDDNFFALPLVDMFKAQALLERAGFATKDQVPYFVWQWLCEWQEQPVVSEAELQQKLGDDIWNSLHPYQRVCVQKAASTKRFMISDEMGTGKTFQCLATCKYFQTQWPVLVFCPSSLRYTWRSEIMQWLGLPASEILVAKNSQHYLKNHTSSHSFLVLPYSLLTNKAVLAAVKEHHYQVVVFDESHYVKSMFSKRAVQACTIAEASDVKLLLSGTPFNYPSEMFQQIKILYPKLYPRFFNYRMEEDRHGEYFYAKRYCRPQSYTVRGHTVWSFKGYDNHEELNALFYTFMIRRRKVDILTQLPEKNRICITLEPLSAKQTKEIAALLKAEKPNPSKKPKDEAAAATTTTPQGEAKYMDSFRLTNKYKIPHVVKFLKEQILEDCMTNDPQMKTLIFFHHEAMQKALEELLRDELQGQFPYFVISGSTSPAQRDAFKEAFQTSDQYRVGLLSITAAGVGLTLTAASTEVFTEILFGPNDHLQAEDRAHRLGQKSAVNIFYLIQPQTTDDINFGLIRKKERESSLMLDGQASALPARRVAAADLAQPTGTLTMQDIMKFHTSDQTKKTPSAKRPCPEEATTHEPPTARSMPRITYATSRRPMVQVYKLQEAPTETTALTDQ